MTLLSLCILNGIGLICLIIAIHIGWGPSDDQIRQSVERAARWTHRMYRKVSK